MEKALEMLTQNQQQMMELMTRQLQPQLPQVELACLKDGENLEEFLETFERVMHLQDIPREEWMRHLIPKFQGRTRDVCAALTYKETYLEK